jgi:hypothetical protein
MYDLFSDKLLVIPVLVADVSDPAGQLQSDEERRFWARRVAEQLARPPPGPPGPHSWGAPPAKWNTLHVDGVRQVRARFPNGNPQVWQIIYARA